MRQLVPTIQNYEWGDTSFIAELQGRDVLSAPEAELWMGAHPSSSARFASSGESLTAAIAADPVGMLGEATAARYGELPFLMKVLAAARPLSIQAHPSQAQAAAGFARENAAGLAPDSPQRTYRDANHKPELVCALTTFEAKCGFRPLEATRELFAALAGPALDELCELLGRDHTDATVLAEVLAWLLRLELTQASRLAATVVDSAAAVASGSPWPGELAWTAEIAQIYPGDIGVVVALLLNHVVLEPGEALFLGAGNLHSYLRGAAMEVMSNSDNVVRGGLTSKHVDVEELLSVVTCRPELPTVQRAQDPRHTFMSAPEFSLTRAVITQEVEWVTSGPEILFAAEGLIEVLDSGGEAVKITSGTPLWVPASEGSYRVRGRGLLFRATVGSPDR